MKKSNKNTLILLIAFISLGVANVLHADNRFLTNSRGEDLRKPFIEQYNVAIIMKEEKDGKPIEYKYKLFAYNTKEAYKTLTDMMTWSNKTFFIVRTHQNLIMFNIEEVDRVTITNSRYNPDPQEIPRITNKIDQDHLHVYENEIWDTERHPSLDKVQP